MMGRVYLIAHIDNRPRFSISRDYRFPKARYVSKSAEQRTLQRLEMLVGKGVLKRYSAKGNVYYERIETSKAELEVG